MCANPGERTPIGVHGNIQLKRVTQRNTNRTVSLKPIFKIHIVYEVILYCLCLFYHPPPYDTKIMIWDQLKFGPFLTI